jgi:hypothetical protein
MVVVVDRADEVEVMTEDEFYDEYEWMTFDDAHLQVEDR